jgi:hypothetical protein
LDLFTASDADLDIVRGGLDDRQRLEEIEAVLELFLHRLHEQLLPHYPVEVRVGMTEADEVERAAARQALIARLEVDRRVPGRADLVVDVAPVDVDPDATERVDDFLEAAEVDRDQVVDR